MPGSIALTLCIIFTLYLFITDSRRQREVSCVNWIPLIWMLILTVRPVSQWLNQGIWFPADIQSPDVYLEGDPLDRYIFSVLIAVGLFILWRRRISWSDMSRTNILILLYFLYCGISIIWSDFHFVSFKRWIKEIGSLVMVVVVLTEPDPIGAVKTLFRRFAYVVIPLSVVLVKYFHAGKAFGLQGRRVYVGVTGDKNALGALCLVCCLFFTWNLLTMWRERKQYFDLREFILNVCFLALTFYLMAKADSATSVAVFIGGTLCLAVSGLPSLKLGGKMVNLRGNPRAIDFYLILAILGLLLFCLVDIWGIVVNALNRNPTMTGRSELWRRLIDVGTNPLIGVGYESFWLGDRVKQIWEEYWWHPNESHNGFLEVYLNLGAIGVSLLVGVMVSVYRYSKKMLVTEYDFARFRLAFLGVTLLYSISEAAFRTLSLVWFVFILIAAKPPRPIAAPEVAKDNRSRSIQGFWGNKFHKC